MMRSNGGRPAEPLLPDRAVGHRRSLAWAIALACVAVASAQIELFLARNASAAESYAGLALVPAIALLLAIVGSRIEGRSLREMGFLVRSPLGPTVAFASVVAFAFLTIRLDPGYVLGFGKVPPLDPWLFGFFLLSAPLVALGQVGFFFGYLLRTLARHVRLPTAFLVASTFFAGFSTSVPTCLLLTGTGLVEYLFLVTLSALVEGLALAFYVYKAGWSLVGPVAAAAGIAAATELVPVGVQFPTWEANFACLMAAYAVVVFLVGFGLREPRLQSLRYLGLRIGPRRYRFRNRASDLRALRSTLVGAIAVGAVVVSAAYGLPAALDTPKPLLAIATGSMVPTLEPGTFVVVEHVAPSAIHVGTIIAFDAACLPSPTVHRVVSIVSRGPDWAYQTKGDANPTQDPCTVPYSQVLGAVVLTIPYLGYFILDPILAVSVIALLLIATLAWKERWN